MEQTKYDVFISYSHRDYVDEQKNVIPGNEVSKIKEALAKAGITYWIDEEGIYHGDEFSGVIADAIDSSSVFVFMSSESSNNAPWTIGEIATAQEAGKKIIPVRIDSSRYHKSLRVRLNALDYIDFTKNTQKGCSELVRSIKAYLKETELIARKKKEEELNLLNEKELYPTEKDEKYGFVDESGGVVILCEWEYVYPFTEGLARVKDTNEQWGFIDKTGKVVIPCKWKDAFPFIEGMARVKDTNEQWGFIDKTGKVVIPCRWKDAFPFVEGLARVRGTNERWGFIDKKGKVVISCKWKYADNYSEGFSPIQDDNKQWGFIDKTGKVVIACQWKMAWHFCEGMARVKGDNEQWGFINKTGRLVIPNKWKFVDSFDRGLARVMNDKEQWFYIDKTGRIVKRG